MFFGDEQLVLNTSTNMVVGTRFYTIGGTTIASRTPGVSSGQAQYLIPDRQGTNQLTIDSNTYTVTRRQYLPFGAPRGTPPQSWPGGDKGYIGGTPDPTTSLENLGAREYNPANGRFLSADPVLELTDPNQMGGYDYAGNNPVTGSDPTGLFLPECPDRDCHPAPGVNLTPSPADTGDHQPTRHTNWGGGVSTITGIPGGINVVNGLAIGPDAPPITDIVPAAQKYLKNWSGGPADFYWAPSSTLLGRRVV